MDSDQIGNGPNQSEIDFLYNEALTGLAECTGLAAKSDEALKNGSAKLILLFEAVGANNWESFLQRKQIKRAGNSKGRFQPLVKKAMRVNSDKRGWVSKVAGMLEEAVEKNIPANNIADWIAQTPNGINGIYRLRSQRKKAEKRTAKGLPPLQTKEQKQIAYAKLLSMDFVSEYELPEAWRDHEDTDPVSRVGVDGFEVGLAARFEKGKVKIRGYFVPSPNFWIATADELLRSRSAQPPLDSSFKKNLHPKPSEVGEATDGVDESLDSKIDDEPLIERPATRDNEERFERPALPSIGARPSSQNLTPPAKGLAAITPAQPSSTIIEKGSSTLDRVMIEPSEIHDGGWLVCDAFGGRCRHTKCGERRHCLAKRGRKAWETRISRQIWRAKENGEIINHEEARTRVAARMRRRSGKTAADGERQTTSSGG
jgi:hypothetical protein